MKVFNLFVSRIRFMQVILGLLFAFGAALFWGVGDFLIQKTTRHIVDWETLFLISLIGSIVLLPFVYSSLGTALGSKPDIALLLLISAVMFVQALVNFEAYKRGKMAVIEPIMSLEIPIVAVLSLFFIGEVLAPLEYILIFAILGGLMLVSLKSYRFSGHGLFEKGILLGIASGAMLGTASFIIGFGSRLTSPLIVIWFLSINITVYTATYLAYTKRLHKLMRDAKKRPMLVVSTALLDNFAWLAYAAAAVMLPITIAVALSENFIIVAALLGLFITGERLFAHQKIGLALAVVGAVALALLV